MDLSRRCLEILKSYAADSGRVRGRGVLAIIVVMAAAAGGCVGGPGANENSNLNANASSNANANNAVVGEPLAAREPERYAATMTVAARATVNGQERSAPEVQFQIARLGSDMRWGLTVPPLGEVVYLEKSGLKYLIIPSKNQYVELRGEELGFNIPDLLSPSSVLERLKGRARYETLGTESVNGRPAIKYRFTGQTDTKTAAGTIEAESFVYMDRETGLPLRSEINTTSSSGEKATIVTETRDIQLNPAASLFDVPTGMRKVTSQELKQQVQAFIVMLRTMAEVMRSEAEGPSPSPLPSPSPSVR